MTWNPMQLLDEELAAIAAELPVHNPAEPLAMREAGASLNQEELPVPDGVEREIVHIESDGHEMELRIHRRAGASGEDRGRGEPRAFILAIHGGGFVSGKARYDDEWNAVIAERTGAAVISPDYRLAPEHPYPAGLRDCIAAWTWAVERFPNARPIVYGDSAGGNLATALTLWTRDHGLTLPADAFLIEPVLDDRLETPSMVNGTDTAVWRQPYAVASWAAYFGGAGG